MHNTLVLDGQDHATPSGPFHWKTRADARFLVARTGGAADFAVGTHDAYGPGRHFRAVLAVHGLGWLIVDRIVVHQPTEAQAFWHFHPAWRAAVRDGTVELVHASGRRLALTTTAPDISLAKNPALAEYAPEYGRTERGTTVVARQNGAAPFVIGTFIPSTGPGCEAVAIVGIAAKGAPAAGWVEACFAIRTGEADVEMTVAFPSGAETQPREDWPQPCITRLGRSRTI